MTWNGMREMKKAEGFLMELRCKIIMGMLKDGNEGGVND